MEIRCESCREPIPADDVNLDTVLAKCRKCHAVFDFSGQVDRKDPTPAKQKRDRGDIPMPKGFLVEDDGRTLEIVRRWAKGPGCFFLFFSLLWNGILSIFIVVSFQKETPIFVPLFLLPFVAVGFGTAYATVALFSNRTIIRVDGERLTVVSKPVPWPGKRDLESSSLDQLWCTEYVAYTQNDVPQYRFSVEAMLKDGTKLRLIRGLEEPDQALYLEGLLEKKLGIIDRPMGGELH